jgi:hypothetical protein
METEGHELKISACVRVRARARARAHACVCVCVCVRACVHACVRTCTCIRTVCQMSCFLNLDLFLSVNFHVQVYMFGYQRAILEYHMQLKISCHNLFDRL